MTIELSESKVKAIIAMAREVQRAEEMKLATGLTGCRHRYEAAKALADAVEKAEMDALRAAL